MDEHEHNIQDVDCLQDALDEKDHRIDLLSNRILALELQLTGHVETAHKGIHASLDDIRTTTRQLAKDVSDALLNPIAALEGAYTRLAKRSDEIVRQAQLHEIERHSTGCGNC